MHERKASIPDDFEQIEHTSAFLGAGRWSTSKESPKSGFPAVLSITAMSWEAGAWARRGGWLAWILLLSRAVFFVPKNSTHSGCGGGRDVKWRFASHRLAAWLQLDISSLFPSLCVTATGATNFTSPSTLVLWE